MPKAQVHQFETIKKRSPRSKRRVKKTPAKSGSLALIHCGPTRKMSREELLAGDAAFLARIGRTPKTPPPGSRSARKTTARKASGKAPKFGDLPLEERRKKVHAFINDIRKAWAGKPKIQAVEFLTKMRRGE